MPRFRLPGSMFASRADRAPGDEHERLVLVAQVAGFVVLLAGIAGFVLFAATNGGGSAAPRSPAIPSITDAGGAETTTTAEELAPLPPPPPVTTTPTTPAEVVKPRPKPKPAEPTSARPAPAPPASSLPAPGGDDRVGVPWERCAPEGVHAFTPRFHLPVVCRDGRWRVVSDGSDGPGRHDGRDDHDRGHGGRGGH